MIGAIMLIPYLDQAVRDRAGTPPPAKRNPTRIRTRIRTTQ